MFHDISTKFQDPSGMIRIEKQTEEKIDKHKSNKMAPIQYFEFCAKFGIKLMGIKTKEKNLVFFSRQPKSQFSRVNPS